MSLKKTRLFLRRLTFGSLPITDYLAIGVPSNLDSRAQWQIGSERLEVRSAFVMYDPPLVAIDLEDKPLPIDLRSTSSRLTFSDDGQQEVLGTMKLPADTEIELNQGSFLVYRIADSELILGSLQNRLINNILFRRLKKNHHNFLSHFNPTVYRIISNFFLHPRQVRLLTLQGENGSLLQFPLDLFMRTSEQAFFGLRKTNEAVAQLKIGTRLCLSDVASDYRGIIYRLGKFGGNEEDAPDWVASEEFGLSLPSIFNHYLELEIVETFPFDHQNLFQARILNEVSAENARLALAHIQRLRYSRCPPSYEHELL